MFRREFFQNGLALMSLQFYLHFSRPSLANPQTRGALSDLRANAIIRAASLSQIINSQDLCEGDVVDLPEGQFEIVAAGTYFTNGTTVVDIASGNLQAVLRAGQKVGNSARELISDTRPPTLLLEGTRVETKNHDSYQVLSSTIPDPDIETAGGVKLAMIPKWDSTIFPSQIGITTGLEFTPTQRRTGLQQLIRCAMREQKEVVIPHSELPWAIDAPLRLNGARKLLIHVDGEIENTRDADDYQLNAVFELGNQNPINWTNNKTKLKWMEANPLSAGTDQIVLNKSTDISDNLPVLSIGDIVYVRSKAYRVGFEHDAEHPAFMLCARITGIDNHSGAIFLDRAVCENVTDTLIAKANSSNITDTRGNPIYVADGVHITGSGRLKSKHSVFVRTASLDCTIDVSTLVGSNVLFGNMWANSRVRVDNVIASRKIADIAGCSHESSIEIGKAELFGTGTSGIPAFAIAEGARDMRLHIDQTVAGEWNQNTAFLLIANSRRVRADLGSIFAPRMTSGNGITVTCASAPNSTVARTEDISINLNSANFGQPFRDVYFQDQGGALRRCEIQTGHFVSNPKIAGIELEGNDHCIGSLVRHEVGSIRLSANSTGIRALGCYAEEGLTVESGASLSNHQIRLTSRTLTHLKQGVKNYRSNVASNSTIENDPILVGAFPPNALLPGDEINFQIEGRADGTSGIKKIQIADDDGAIMGLTLNPDEEGNFSIFGTAIVMSDAAIAFSGSRMFQSNTKATPHNLSETYLGKEVAASLDAISKSVNRICALNTPMSTVRTGRSLLKSGYGLFCERWVNSSRDSITIRQASIRVHREGFLT
ncbi:hypothetical protein [Amaricoccus macauensis]|uniref:hypothetical protein n=1 Tax=Amaricoccus macauensis TaxID=57001 RepID=UPI003C7BF254